MEAALAHENTQILHALKHLCCLRSCRRLGGAVLDHFKAHHEAGPTHVPDHVMLPLELPQPLGQVRPNLEAVGLKTIVLDGAQHGAATRRAHGVAAVRVEVQPPSQHLSNFGGGDNGGEGQPVADALGHRHDVRHHSLSLKTPVMSTSTPKPCLHFVCDVDAACLFHHVIHEGQVAVSQGHSAPHALHRLMYKPRHKAAGG
mmetsp:Transcript_13417/g.40576  ORF Transcript_13417/g.40576 Transcript_13417/m.40576 type:complete len:201 (-) Transcript_13417:872-1474(-)